MVITYNLALGDFRFRAVYPTFDPFGQEIRKKKFSAMNVVIHIMILYLPIKFVLHLQMKTTHKLQSPRGFWSWWHVRLRRAATNISQKSQMFDQRLLLSSALCGHLLR